MNLRTANHNRKRAHRLAVMKAAFEFDVGQIARGRDRSRSGFVRRQARRSKAFRRAVVRGLTAALFPPTRAWLRLP